MIRFRMYNIFMKANYLKLSYESENKQPNNQHECVEADPILESVCIACKSFNILSHIEIPYIEETLLLFR